MELCSNIGLGPLGCKYKQRTSHCNRLGKSAVLCSIIRLLLRNG